MRLPVGSTFFGALFGRCIVKHGIELSEHQYSSPRNNYILMNTGYMYGVLLTHLY